jgi:uncharacterized protein YggE
MKVERVSNINVNAHQPGPRPMAMAAFESSRGGEVFRRGEISVQASASITAELREK